jgi:hypothetical protein
VPQFRDKLTLFPHCTMSLCPPCGLLGCTRANCNCNCFCVLLAAPCAAPSQALQCQSAFDARGGRNGITGALGSVCEEGGASFNALGCCQAVSGATVEVDVYDGSAALLR